MAANFADVSEAKAFLDAHPEMQFFEILYTGLSGVPRGKRLRRHELMPLYENGRFLPSSMLVTDITGQDVEADGLHLGRAATRTSSAVPFRDVSPWRPGWARRRADSGVACTRLDSTPIDLDPRHVLARVIDRFAKDGLTPVAACELEYYLLDAQRTARRRRAIGELAAHRRPPHAARSIFAARNAGGRAIPARTVGRGRCDGRAAGRRDQRICARPARTDA